MSILPITFVPHHQTSNFRNCWTSYTSMNSFKNFYNLSCIYYMLNSLFFFKFFMKFIITRASFGLSKFFSPPSITFYIIVSVYSMINALETRIIFITLEITSIEFILTSPSLITSR